MKILLGMSGGIDSTFAALKMKNEGHEVVGAVLVMHDCTDTASAERAAERVGIPLVKIDCRDAFEKEVKSYFVNEYANARTPNPCIVCNREVKFKYLYEYAIANGFDKIATGHYARIVTRSNDGNERYAVARAKDISKDQTYMLYRLSQQVLGYLYLPLADEIKSEAKRLAHLAGIGEQGQKESQEICFIPDNDYRAYIESRVGKFPEGNFIDGHGRLLGTHKGIIAYTVGQRKGLGISLGERAFVSRIDPTDNTITLSIGVSNVVSVTISSVVFSGLYPMMSGDSVNITAKVRYQARPVAATARCLSEDSIQIVFDEPISAVAPGQSLVAYEGDTVLFGGFIEEY